MERIVTTAIVGTGQIQLQEASTGTPVDALAAQLVGEQERKLLLTAGAWSIYRRAGYCARANIDGFNPVQALSGKDIGSRSHPGEKVHTPNPNESSEDALAPCSPRATHLLSMLLARGGRGSSRALATAARSASTYATGAITHSTRATAASAYPQYTRQKCTRPSAPSPRQTRPMAQSL